VFNIHSSTHYWSLWTRSSQPITWLVHKLIFLTKIQTGPGGSVPGSGPGRSTAGSVLFLDQRQSVRGIFRKAIRIFELRFNYSYWNSNAGNSVFVCNSVKGVNSGWHIVHSGNGPVAACQWSQWAWEGWVICQQSASQSFRDRLKMKLLLSMKMLWTD